MGRARATFPPLKRYDNDRILSALAGRVADEVVDRESGDVPPVAVIVERVANEVARATGCLTASYTGWRKGVMDGHGLSLEGFRVESARGALKVVVETEEEVDEE
jgi:hypothetical protein